MRFSKNKYSPKLHNTKRKFVRNFIGLAVMVVGLGIGVVLVSQQQFFSQRAARTDYFTPRPTPTTVANCYSSSLDCRSKKAIGSITCRQGKNPVYCCPEENMVVRSGRCVRVPASCDAPWINRGCGEGSCKDNELLQVKDISVISVITGCGGPTRRCLAGYDVCQ